MNVTPASKLFTHHILTCNTKNKPQNTTLIKLQKFKQSTHQTKNNKLK